LLHQKSIDLVHPEDQPKVTVAMDRLRAGADGTSVECRAKKSDGNYLWVEASLRTIRDPLTGVPTGILDSVRDISERKIAEQQLADAYHTLEELAITDPLTGLANRRQFDRCLATEWRRGMRNLNPLSMLLVDVDLFKSYNDTYGHLRGDGCLRQIAEAAQNAVTRQGDLVARFGGEEFAIILPNTPNEGAIELAEGICEALRARKLLHKGNPHGVITASIGCATMIPQLGQSSASLIELADQALYKAKRSGRNRVCAGESVSSTPGQKKAISIKRSKAN
jgi:diguanylate cyclase (GGDEF)-like protein